MIRDAVESDLESIVRIYNASVPGRLATADTEPVSVESRRGWFRERDFARHPLWVAERTERGGPDRIVGWLGFGKFYGRPAYAATAEVSVYVDPAEQRAGIATELMNRALERAPSLGLRTFLGFVFAHNDPSIALCQRFGFEEWGRLPRVAVLDGVERDVVILGRRVGTGSGNGAPGGPGNRGDPS